MENIGPCIAKIISYNPHQKITYSQSTYNIMYSLIPLLFHQSAHRSQLSASMFVYDCLWRGCDYQYEDLQDLRVHVLDSFNHLKKVGEYESQFHAILKGNQPFASKRGACNDT
jgi:hypothetical protein